MVSGILSEKNKLNESMARADKKIADFFSSHRGKTSAPYISTVNDFAYKEMIIYGIYGNILKISLEYLINKLNIKENLKANFYHNLINRLYQTSLLGRFYKEDTIIFLIKKMEETGFNTKTGTHEEFGGFSYYYEGGKEISLLAIIAVANIDLTKTLIEKEIGTEADDIKTSFVIDKLSRLSLFQIWDRIESVMDFFVSKYDEEIKSIDNNIINSVISQTVPFKLMQKIIHKVNNEIEISLKKIPYREKVFEYAVEESLEGRDRGYESLYPLMEYLIDLRLITENFNIEILERYMDTSEYIDINRKFLMSI